MRSPGVGGYFYPTTNHPSDAIWTAESLPSVIALTKLPPELGNSKFKPKPLSLDPILAAEGDDYVIERLGARMRVHLDSRGTDPPAVLLPLDRLLKSEWQLPSGYGERSTAAILARIQRRSPRPG
jgi:hypothetical protein